MEERWNSYNPETLPGPDSDSDLASDDSDEDYSCTPIVNTAAGSQSGSTQNQ